MQHLSAGFVLLTTLNHIHFLSKESNQYLIAAPFCVRCLKFTPSTWQGLLSGQQLPSLPSEDLKYLSRAVSHYKADPIHQNNLFQEATGAFCALINQNKRLNIKSKFKYLQLRGL